MKSEHMTSTEQSPRPVHPAATMFPMIEGAEYEAFREDIRQRGLLHPIEVLPDGSVIDGRNRLRACLEVGIEPSFKTVNPESPVAHVLSANKHRRHLTSSQLGVIGAEEALRLRPEAESRKLDGNKRGGVASGEARSGSKSGKLFSQTSPGEARYPETVEKAAGMVGTNPQYVQIGLTLLKNAPDLAQKVKDGVMKIREAQVECKERTGRRAEIVANAAIRKASEWLGRIQGVPGYCEGVSCEAIRSNALLLRNWQEALSDAVASMRALQKRLES